MSQKEPASVRADVGEVPGKKLGREWRFLRSAIRNCISGQAEEDELMRALSKSGVKFSLAKRKSR